MSVAHSFLAEFEERNNFQTFFKIYPFFLSVPVTDLVPQKNGTGTGTVGTITVGTGTEPVLLFIEKHSILLVYYICRERVFRQDRFGTNIGTEWYRWYRVVPSAEYGATVFTVNFKVPYLPFKLKLFSRC